MEHSEQMQEQDTALALGVMNLAEIEAAAMDWVWPRYLAAGTVTTLSGGPGVGKTYLGLAIAAALTTGRVPGSDQCGTPVDVLYINGDDSPRQILRPRFDRLGGDPTRLHVMTPEAVVGSRSSADGQNNNDGGGSRASAVGQTNDALDTLAEAVRQTRARLVIIDTFDSLFRALEEANIDAVLHRPRRTDIYVSARDAQKETQARLAQIAHERTLEVRRILDGLALLAEEHHCSVLVIRQLQPRHVGRPARREAQTIDLTGMLPIELFAGYNREDPAERVLLATRCQLSAAPPPLGYTILDDGRLRWTGESDESAPAVAQPQVTALEKRALREATDFLRAILEEGPQPVPAIRKEARDAGIAPRVLERARWKLGIVAKKTSSRQQAASNKPGQTRAGEPEEIWEF